MPKQTQRIIKLSKNNNTAFDYRCLLPVDDLPDGGLEPGLEVERDVGVQPPLPDGVRPPCGVRSPFVGLLAVGVRDDPL